MSSLTYTKQTQTQYAVSEESQKTLKQDPMYKRDRVSEPLSYVQFAYNPTVVEIFCKYVTEMVTIPA